MADLWYSLVEALRVDLVKFLSEIFFLCSVILVPSCLPVSPIYTFSYWLHGILYTTPAFFCSSTVSFGWTKTCLRVLWVATLCFVNIRCIFSMNEWTHGTVTTPLDFSCALSFLDLSFLYIHLSGFMYIYIWLDYDLYIYIVTGFMKTWLQWVSKGPMLSASLVPRLWPSPPRTMGDCLHLPLSSAIVMIIILSRGLIQLARAN